MKTRVIAGLALTGAAVLASCSQDRSPVGHFSLQKLLSPSRPPRRRPARSRRRTTTRDRTSRRTRMTSSCCSTRCRRRTGTAAPRAPRHKRWVRGPRDVLGTATDLRCRSGREPLAGQHFANDVLLCMGARPLDLSGALGPTGLFAVRDSSSNYADHLAPAGGWRSGHTAPSRAPATGRSPGPTLFYASQISRPWPTSCRPASSST